MTRWRVEVPRGARIKRDAHGRIDLVSPFACPFDYGCLPDVPSADGEPADAVILGGPRRRGDEGRGTIWHQLRFIDGGRPDDKWVIGEGPPTDAELAQIITFFRRYASIKRVFGRDAAYLGSVRVS